MTQPASDAELLGDDKSLAVPWPNVPLPDLLSLIVDNRGKTVPATSSGIPLIATDCIKEDALYPVRQNLRYVSKGTYETWFRGHPEPGDVILVNKGTPGRVCQVPAPVDFCIAQDMVSLRPKPGVVDSDYLLAALRSPNFKEQVEGLHVGMVIPHLKKADFPHLKIPLPPLPIQRPIGRIYCDLSRKIELNRRINRTLEELAAALFRSWFVDFDPVVAKAAGRQPAHVRPELAALFPAHWQDSPLGPIPHGWRVANLGDAIGLAYGKALKADIRQLGTIPVFGSNGQVGWHDRKLVEGPGIVVGRKGNPGIVTWVAEDFFPIDTSFYVERKVKTLGWQFLFHALGSMELEGLAADSAVPGLNRNAALQNNLLIPPKEICDAFESMTTSWWHQVRHNIREARTLAALRDTLLPKLLSGELRVKPAEKLLEAKT